MRALIILLAMLFATPSFAATSICSINGPHNCAEQNEDALIALTKTTINVENLAHPQHAFKTQNDQILESAARAQAQLDSGKAQLASRSYAPRLLY